MYRWCKRKTERGTAPVETYMEAAKEVLAKARSLRKASAKYSVNFMTLQEFRKRLEEGRGSYFYIKQFCDSSSK
jgi:hypothetical protein